MGTSVGELFVSLGFDVDKKALESFEAGIKNLSSNMLELLGISGITTYGVNKFVTGALDGAQTMQNMAQGTRLATDELQRYAAVTNILNPKISTEGAASAISDLDKRLNDWRLGLSDGAPVGAAAGRAGISIGNMNAIQFLDALRQKFPGIDPTLQGGILRQAGLPPEFLNVLNATPDTFNKIASTVSLTKTELDNLAESSRRLNKVFVEFSTWLEKRLAWFITPKDQRAPISPYIYSDSKSQDDDLKHLMKDSGKKTKSFFDYLFSGDVDAPANINTKDQIKKIIPLSPIGAKNLDQYLTLPPLIGDQYLPKLPAVPPPFDGGPQGDEVKTSRNTVTIYNHGEVKPETWAGYTLNSYQNAMYQQNNAAVA